MFEINYSQLIQYEILEKLVTYIAQAWLHYSVDDNPDNPRRKKIPLCALSMS